MSPALTTKATTCDDERYPDAPVLQSQDDCGPRRVLSRTLAEMLDSFHESSCFQYFEERCICETAT